MAVAVCVREEVVHVMIEGVASSLAAVMGVSSALSAGSGEGDA